MPAATFDRDTRQLGTGAPLNDVAIYPVKAGEKGFGGTIGVRDASGRAVRAVVATGLTCVGRVRTAFDNSANGAADGDVTVPIERGIYKWANPAAPHNIGSGNAALAFVPKKKTVTVTIVVSGNLTAFSIAVSGDDITINSATNGGGTATTTASAALASLLANTSAMALLTSVALADGSTGASVLGAVSQTTLRWELIDAIDSDCYILSDQEVVATDGGTARSRAGKVHQIDPDGVYVRMGV